MAYDNIGYNENLTRSENLPTESQQLDPLQFENFAPQISGTKIEGGIIKSRNGILILDTSWQEDFRTINTLTITESITVPSLAIIYTQVQGSGSAEANFRSRIDNIYSDNTNKYGWPLGGIRKTLTIQSATREEVSQIDFIPLNPGRHIFEVLAQKASGATTFTVEGIWFQVL